MLRAFVRELLPLVASVKAEMGSHEVLACSGDHEVVSVRSISR